VYKSRTWSSDLVYWPVNCLFTETELPKLRLTVLPPEKKT